MLPSEEKKCEGTLTLVEEETDPLRTDPSTDARGWCHWLATWNNPPDDWAERLTMTGCTYWAGQLERGKKGTLHVQFYMWFDRAKRIMHLKKKIRAVSWFGKISPAAKDCWEYCKKIDDTTIPNTWREWGRKPQWYGAEKKNRYKDAHDACKNGDWTKSDAEIIVKYYGNLTKLTALYTQPLATDTCRGVWIYGTPGAGKSTAAREQFPSPQYHKSQSKWWDNYNGEPTVILEDFDHHGACLSHLLKLWLDKFALKGEIKGGSIALNYKQFVITSNYTPEEIWPGDQHAVLRTAIRRRCRFATLVDFNLVFAESTTTKETECNYMERLGGWLLEH